MPIRRRSGGNRPVGGRCHHRPGTPGAKDAPLRPMPLVVLAHGIPFATVSGLAERQDGRDHVGVPEDLATARPRARARRHRRAGTTSTRTSRELVIEAIREVVGPCAPQHVGRPGSVARWVASIAWDENKLVQATDGPNADPVGLTSLTRFARKAGHRQRQSHKTVPTADRSSRRTVCLISKKSLPLDPASQNFGQSAHQQTAAALERAPGPVWRSLVHGLDVAGGQFRSIDELDGGRAPSLTYHRCLTTA